MDIKTKFDLGQRVVIEEVGALGRIADISYSYSGLTYKIEYWKEAEPKSAWCREDEISEPSKKGQLGMGPQ